MDSLKEMELEILEGLNQAPDGTIIYEDFIKMFSHDPIAYNTAFTGMTTPGYTFISRGSDSVRGHYAEYKISNPGKLRIKQLQREKAEEILNKEIQERLVEDSRIVKWWTQKIGLGTLILIFLTLVLVVMTGVLIYFEYHPRH